MMKYKFVVSMFCEFLVFMFRQMYVKYFIDTKYARRELEAFKHKEYILSKFSVNKKMRSFVFIFV